MKLIIGKKYNTPHGVLEYRGRFEIDVPCDICGKSRYNYKLKVWNSHHHFNIVYNGETSPDNWMSFGTCCIKKIIMEFIPITEESK